MGRWGALARFIVTAGLLAIAAPSYAETRLALIITNADYPPEIGALANPHKDGAVIAAALRNVGFEQGNVAVIKDADQPTFRTAVADFIERIEKAGSDAVVLLYYSGHGAADRTERGENYLIPVGAKISLAKQLPILGVSLSEITKALERVPAKARFVIVDACRNVAFTKGLKDAAKGFVPERKLDGMIVAFATRPGETAEDNNVYASALASILPTPGLRAEEVFKETQLRVADLTKGTQVPWTEDGLLARFKFKEGETQPIAPQSGWSAAEREWQQYGKDTKDIRLLEAFKEKHRVDPVYVRLAEARIEELKREEDKRAEAESQAMRRRQEEEKRKQQAEAEARAKEAERQRVALLQKQEERKQAEADARAKAEADREHLALLQKEEEDRKRAEEQKQRQAAPPAPTRLGIPIDVSHIMGAWRCKYRDAEAAYQCKIRREGSRIIFEKTGGSIFMYGQLERIDERSIRYQGVWYLPGADDYKRRPFGENSYQDHVGLMESSASNKLSLTLSGSANDGVLDLFR